MHASIHTSAVGSFAFIPIFDVQTTAADGSIDHPIHINESTQYINTYQQQTNTTTDATDAISIVHSDTQLTDGDVGGVYESCTSSTQPLIEDASSTQQRNTSTNTTTSTNPRMDDKQIKASKSYFDVLHEEGNAIISHKMNCIFDHQISAVPSIDSRNDAGRSVCRTTDKHTRIDTNIPSSNPADTELFASVPSTPPPIDVSPPSSSHVPITEPSAPSMKTSTPPMNDMYSMESTSYPSFEAYSRLQIAPEDAQRLTSPVCGGGQQQAIEGGKRMKYSGDTGDTGDTVSAQQLSEAFNGSNAVGGMEAPLLRWRREAMDNSSYANDQSTSLSKNKRGDINELLIQNFEDFFRQNLQVIDEQAFLQ